ncbi:MAG: FAD-dependent oxidoreductase [Methylophilales bacterium]|nr:FAD-dependent oxidoreductase [Methylophilales bacterium]
MSQPIIIIGGGPVGATLALLLVKQGVSVTVLEARSLGAAHSESRALALSFGSRRILEKFGLWGAVSTQATPINSIHVSQKGSFGRTQLHAGDYHQEALGYVLSYGVLSAALDRAIADAKSVNFIFEASASSIVYDVSQATVTYTHGGLAHSISSPLVVLADGGRTLDELTGLSRETKEYGHDALVTKVRAELPHHNVAYERFTANGPIALLPNGGEFDFSLVWTGEKSFITSMLSLSDADFLEKFHQQFADRVGDFLSVEKRLSFPLKMAQLKPDAQQSKHLVVIGNAAQTMHPVAGQGFNVGLRDAESLAQYIASASADELGSAYMLASYQASRKSDTKGGLFFTDFLVNLFSNDLVGLSALRCASLGVFDVIKPVKKYLVGKMSFGK